MRDEASERRASITAGHLRRIFDFPVPPKIGIVLGTGWGGTLGWKRECRAVSFEEISGFNNLPSLEGHARKVLCGDIEDKPVIALSGRLHVNEVPLSDPHSEEFTRMVRLQVEMLLKLGVETLILTAAAGSLHPKILVGNFTIVDGFISLFAPDMPLFGGEFVSPDDALDPHLRECAVSAVKEAGGMPHMGGHAMVRGPFFEGRRYDKPLLALSGASTVGMSMLPEACIAALYPPVKVLALTFITNSAFETHSHETNQVRAREKSEMMGEVLRGIIKRI